MKDKSNVSKELLSTVKLEQIKVINTRRVDMVPELTTPLSPLFKLRCDILTVEKMGFKPPVCVFTHEGRSHAFLNTQTSAG